MKSRKDLPIQVSACESAWQGLAPGDVFAGATVQRFAEVAKASLDARAKLHAIDVQRRKLLEERNLADARTRDLLKRVALAVQADPKHGVGSALHVAMGLRARAQRTGAPARRAESADETPVHAEEKAA